ncbi:hypothetical protein MXD61_11355 [Frankia sp. AgPm24]|uniref:hypothetical protein n=1 Tax=Frankia sp. AgPm24 TaxID=631128 RepID=UPI00200E0C1B|nr:hypothetical protein [Frankia sp. AgPm24]MCK9922469.1 hypothetical protein [Frankia sp. AgPm24]
MSSRERAEVTKLLCWAIGEGYRVGRVEILADLDGWRRRAGLVPTAVKLAAPVAPAPSPLPACPDRAVGLAEAARLLEISEVTVRRYLAPSSGRLARLDGGVSLASIEAYRHTRDAAVLRTRWSRTESTPARCAA